MNKDKELHHVIGFVGFYLWFGLIYLAGFNTASLGAFVVAGLASWLIMRFFAFAKEAYDQKRPEKHTNDALDAESTIGGASLAYAGLIVFALLTHP